MSRKLILGLGLNSLFVVIEFVAAAVTGSLALLSDAGHNFADSFALGLALFAVHQARKLPTGQKTFGFVRTGVLAALLNSTILIAITGYIFYKASARMINPPPVPGKVIIFVAGIGFIINSAIALGLRKQKDINIRAAFLHLVTDALVSLSVMAAGLIALTTGFNLIDPLISLGIGVFIIISAWGVIREAIDILMEATPRGLDLDGVARAMMSVNGIKNVHHLHVWEIGANLPALSCHIVVEDMALSRSTEIMAQLERVLVERFGIIHPTIQIETEICVSDGSCQLSRVESEMIAERPHGD